MKTTKKNTCSYLAVRHLASLIATILRPPTGGVGGVGKKRPHRQQEGLAVWAVWAAWSPIDSSLKSNTHRVSSRNGTYYSMERGKGGSTPISGALDWFRNRARKELGLRP